LQTVIGRNDVLSRARCFVSVCAMAEEPLISREELTAMLFGIADIRRDVREIRIWLKNGEDDGEAPEDDA
jgi:hypothetical protein